MALPSSGSIALSQVNVELGLTATAPISLNDAAVRNLFGVPSGTINMSDGYGKANKDGSSPASAGDSAQQIKQLTGTTTTGDYWINVNGTPRLIFCDMNGSYTGDGANGYMLYQNAGSSPFASGKALRNTGQVNWSSNGWSPAPGNTVVGGDNLQGWQSRYSVANMYHTWIGGLPPVSVMAIRWGNANGGNNATLFINGVNTQVVGPSQYVTTIASFNTSGNVVQLQEVGGIVAYFYMFVR